MWGWWSVLENREEKGGMEDHWELKIGISLEGIPYRNERRRINE